MDTFKTLKSSLKNLNVETLLMRKKAVESDIENLEEELQKRYELLKYVDSLIVKKRLTNNR